MSLADNILILVYRDRCCAVLMCNHLLVSSEFQKKTQSFLQKNDGPFARLTKRKISKTLNEYPRVRRVFEKMYRILCFGFHKEMAKDTSAEQVFHQVNKEGKDLDGPELFKCLNREAVSCSLLQ